MQKVDVVRAWKDEDYRESLSAEERAALPENPVGVVDLTASELAWVSGGEVSVPEEPLCGSTLVCTAWATCGDPRPGGGSGPCY